MVFAGYSGLLHYLQLASHELATIGINVTKTKFQIQILMLGALTNIVQCYQGPVSRIVKYESFVIYDFLNLGTFLRRSVIAFLEALRK